MKNNSFARFVRAFFAVCILRHRSLTFSFLSSSRSYEFDSGMASARFVKRLGIIEKLLQKRVVTFSDDVLVRRGCLSSRSLLSEDYVIKQLNDIIG